MDSGDRQNFVIQKVLQWSNHVRTLAAVASLQHKPTNAAVTKSLQSKWLFSLRVIPHCGSLFADLEKSLSSCFLPALFGVEVSAIERQLFSLPLQFGGLGVFNPVTMSDYCYDSSVRSTLLLRKSILGSATFEFDAHVETVQSARHSDRQYKIDHFTDVFDQLIGMFDSLQQRAVLRAKDSNLSSWLSVVPLESYHFDLSPQEFRDALALRYRKPLLDLPPFCDGCGAPFTVEHSLDCRVGGLVGYRHNEVRDAVGDLASLAWGQVTREPVICESSPVDPSSVTLIADLQVRGVWQPQVDVLFDVRVVDTDAPSYRGRSLQAVLDSAEAEKKRKYLEACLARHAGFTPLYFLIDGMLGSEADCFFRRLTDRLCAKWERSYSAVVGWVPSSLSFAVLRATILCVRGLRSSWKSLGIVDGASISESD